MQSQEIYSKTSYPGPRRMARRIKGLILAGLVSMLAACGATNESTPQAQRPSNPPVTVPDAENYDDLIAKYTGRIQPEAISKYLSALFLTNPEGSRFNHQAFVYQNLLGKPKVATPNHVIELYAKNSIAGFDIRSLNGNQENIRLDELIQREANYEAKDHNLKGPVKIGSTTYTDGVIFRSEKLWEKDSNLVFDNLPTLGAGPLMSEDFSDLNRFLVLFDTVSSGNPRVQLLELTSMHTEGNFGLVRVPNPKLASSLMGALLSDNTTQSLGDKAGQASLICPGTSGAPGTTVAELIRISEDPNHVLDLKFFQSGGAGQNCSDGSAIQFVSPLIDKTILINSGIKVLN